MSILKNIKARDLRAISVSAIVVILVVTWLLIRNQLFITLGIAISTVVLLHTLVKLSTIIRPESKIKYRFDKKYKPFVSVHVACKSEPADLVNRTVEALTKLDYSNYEVIVINSNNTDKKNWLKIKQYVDGLNDKDKYKFVHLDKVQGFKAGALNHLVDKHASPDAEIIAIVDCDYIVTRDFLSKTVGYFKDERVGIVQAPQDYYNIDKYNTGLFYEYRSFFRLVMHQAQNSDFVNFTGTMGLIRASLLQSKDMQWSEWCITEDTEAGTRINAMGYKGVFVDESLGRGLMPYDYASLARQRQRWVYGNAQIIWSALSFVLFKSSFNFKQMLSFISQLTTWFHFELLVAGMYLIINSLALIFPNEQAFVTTSIALATAMFISILGNFIYFVVGLRKDTGIINRIKAFFAHYGLIYVMSSGWMIFLMGYNLGFNVTSKEKYNPGLQLKQIVCELAVSLLLAITMVVKLLAGNVMAISVASVALFIAIELIGVLYMNRSFIKSNKLEEDHENSLISATLENSSTAKVRRNRVGSRSADRGTSKTWS